MNIKIPVERATYGSGDVFEAKLKMSPGSDGLRPVRSVGLRDPDGP
jgi:hypothetical protein